MNNFKTKYKSCLSTTDELQYVKQSDSSPNPFKENAPREKKANYTISNVVAVSGGKYLPINQEQLSGKGVDKSKQIYNDIDINPLDGYTALGKIDGWSNRRIFKKDGIIYDLIN